MKGEVMNREAAYRVGALLYAPAKKKDIAQKILENEIPLLTSVALCLEDATSDAELPRAKAQLLKTLSKLSECRSLNDIPMIFVRVRNPEHLVNIAGQLSEHSLSVTGFILPKFDLSNAVEYMNATVSLPNICRDCPYVMPILETRAIADPQNRKGELSFIKQVLDANKDIILNVRVGGNDLCNLYGVRRSPRVVLVNSTSDDRHLGHIYQLAEEKNVPVELYPLRNYRVCGIIEEMADC